MPEVVSASRAAQPAVATSDPSPLAGRILLVEDNEDDVVLFQRLLRRASANAGLDVITEGETAIHWLADKITESNASAAALPRVIFLDLRLPGIAGSDVLRWIRRQPALQSVFVVICTSSTDARDVAEAERLGANVFVTKFPRVDELAAMLKITVEPTVRAAMLPAVSR